jgi:hypothetical protein
MKNPIATCPFWPVAIRRPNSTGLARVQRRRGDELVEHPGDGERALHAAAVGESHRRHRDTAKAECEQTERMGPGEQLDVAIRQTLAAEHPAGGKHRVRQCDPVQADRTFHHDRPTLPYPRAAPSGEHREDFAGPRV